MPCHLLVSFLLNQFIRQHNNFDVYKFTQWPDANATCPISSDPRGPVMWPGCRKSNCDRVSYHNYNRYGRFVNFTPKSKLYIYIQHWIISQFKRTHLRLSSAKLHFVQTWMCHGWLCQYLTISSLKTCSKCIALKGRRHVKCFHQGKRTATTWNNWISQQYTQNYRPK